MKKLGTLFILSLIPTVAICSIPKGNGTWAYDTTYKSGGKKSGQQPGLFAPNINKYNTSAGAGHKITQVFSYGGDMEMYCQGSGGSGNGTPCNASTLTVGYDKASTTAYYNAAAGTSNPVMMVPIVDGVVGGEYLKTFNKLSAADAATYADNVAKLYCADDHVYGVQFDLEPFNINAAGQAAFFTQIAKNFAGKHNGSGKDPYGCVNATHPQGRFFSVFTYAGQVTSKLASIFNQYGNGYVIDSLYDLGDQDGGIVTPPNTYTSQVKSEVQKMVANCKTYGVKYQFGIPAAASVHEFESVKGKSTGYSQLQYVQAAINAINNSGARQDANFLGIDLWGWNQQMWWDGMQFTPPIPQSNVQSYLYTNL
jgi:hypothetical protein